MKCHNKMRRPVAVLLGILVMMLGMMHSFAFENLDPDRTGSLHLEIRYDGKPVTGGDMWIYRVAEVYADNGWHFRLVPELADSGISLEDLEAPNLVKDLEAAVEAAGLKGQQKYFDENGVADFKDLPLGLYLMVQKKPSDGFELLSTVLVSVPQKGEDGYVYDVDATPKPTVKKTEEPEPPEPPKPPKPEEPDLPQTGQLNWPIPVMAAGGVLCLLIGTWLLKGRKERRS